MDVVLSQVEKKYPDGTVGVRSLDLSIRSGEFFTLLGPSGCGKTTTLRMVAGLEMPTAGSLRIGSRDVTKVPPGDRDVAMVFQSYALYPHMTVRGNLTLNLEVHNVAPAEIEKRLRETAAMLDIEALIDKKPGQLSGGQRQRVALGRALIRRPSVFLMDEPLSNLDLKLREQMRTELKRLHQELKITTIYVTHDQVEALTLSDRIAVMGSGELQQVGTADEVYRQPHNMFVAEFIGSPGVNLFSIDPTRLRAPRYQRFAEAIGAALGKTIGVRPEDVQFAPEGAGDVDCTVEFIERYGAMAYAFLRCEDIRPATVGREHLVVGMPPTAAVNTGDRISVRFPADSLMVFDSFGNRVAHTGYGPHAHSPLAMPGNDVRCRD